MDLKYKNGVASLAISEVFPEDEGEYTLRAINSQGQVETTCKVTVKREYWNYIPMGTYDCTKTRNEIVVDVKASI